jgi:hypothetical protein
MAWKGLNFSGDIHRWPNDKNNSNPRQASLCGVENLELDLEFNHVDMEFE